MGAIRSLYVPNVSSIPNGDLIPVIGYARVSTWREEMISVDIQKSVVEDAAARRGRYVAEWVIDPDDTGRNFKRRVMQAIEIIEDPERPERELWSWKFSRFGRNRHGVAINLARIENVGGELVSATEDVDSKTAVGRFTRGMLLEVAAFESDRAGEIWKETHALRRKLGLPSSGGRRFGYTWHPRRIPDNRGGFTTQEEWYELRPTEAELIHEAYTEYTKGVTGFSKLAQRWNDLGMRTARGSVWLDQTVRGFLDSAFPAGVLRVHNPEAICGEPGRCQKPAHLVFMAAEHEAAIDGDLWDAFRAMRAERANTPRRALRAVYPLSGLIWCGLCGSKAQTTGSAERPAKGYRCNARARKGTDHEPVWATRWMLEKQVRDDLDEVLAEIDDIAAGQVVIPEPRREPDLELVRARLTATLERATSALDRAFNAYALGDVDRDTYLRTRVEHQKNRDEAKAKLAELDEPDEPEPTSPLPFRDVVAGLIEEWDTIDVPSKRLLLSRIITRIELWPVGEQRIIWRWTPAEPLPKWSVRRAD
ncbi:recombinase family protein [Streptomyces seoulensis]|uniref:recombinase family protein n=1 Tax=Streptomyces seoulensis TaxID=73044 RepID=UPI002067F4DA|nr:recombinase family protein [Streptomyces seoulensis]BDH04851.1 resolvase [Streptomyces seoulensis]